MDIDESDKLLAWCDGGGPWPLPSDLLLSLCPFFVLYLDLKDKGKYLLLSSVPIT